MELKGKIDNYGIADIFQLIGQQRRSGILTVRSGKNAAEVYFVQGMISRAHPSYTVPRENPFGECAVKAELISEKNLQKALAVQEQTLKTLEEVFVEMQFLEKLNIQKLNNFLLSETLYDVLQWTSGEYEFTMKEVEHDERFYDSVSVDHILLDVLRMIDEEPDLLRRVPNYNIVFQKTSSSDDDEIGCVSSDDEDEEIYEHVVYSLVNGQNTVRDIIDQTLLGRYHTLNALVSLIEAGVITKTSLGKVEPQKAPPRKSRIFTYFSYSVLPALLLIFVALKVGVTDVRTVRDCKQWFKPAFLERTRLSKITNALNVYYLRHGTYPGSLSALVETGLLREADLSSINGPVYRYTLLNSHSFHLE